MKHGGDRTSKKVVKSTRFVERVMLHLYAESSLSLREMGRIFGMSGTGAHLAVKRAQLQHQARRA